MAPHYKRPPSPMPFNLFKSVVSVAAVLFLLAGCKTPSLDSFSLSPKAKPAIHRPSNVFSVEFLPADFVKVAVLPVHHKLDSADVAPFLDGTFLNELNGKGQLEAVPVTGAALQQMTGRSALASTDPLPSGLLAQIRAKYGADGVLLTDLTHYHPYKPISVGVRCKLADAVTGEILWSADAVYNAGNQEIQAAALYFHKQKSGSPFPLEDSGSILQSPRFFSRFVASSMLDTLPRR